MQCSLPNKPSFVIGILVVKTISIVILIHALGLLASVPAGIHNMSVLPQFCGLNFAEKVILRKPMAVYIFASHACVDTLLSCYHLKHIDS